VRAISPAILALAAVGCGAGDEGSDGLGYKGHGKPCHGSNCDYYPPPAVAGDAAAPPPSASPEGCPDVRPDGPRTNLTASDVRVRLPGLYRECLGTHEFAIVVGDNALYVELPCRVDTPSSEQLRR
jgi:hypothetical protein